MTARTQRRPVAGSLERRAAAREWLRCTTRPGEEGGVVVKLCGMSREQDVDAACDARADLCGFIVDFPKSHRSVTPERLAQLTAHLEARTGEGGLPWRVGVFVDAPADDIARIVRECGLDLVQLHGHETPADVRALRLAAPELGIIQAFRVRTADDVAQACESRADVVLLDNGQGTGQTFDWSCTARADRPFLLAGGLGPDNVADAVAQVRPWGVDMSSGIETDKLKDPVKMKAAVAAAKGA